MRRRSVVACAAVGAGLTFAGAAPALADDDERNGSGFRTSRSSMLTPVMPGAQVTPLLTVGDRLKNGYRFESIPDGISVRTRGQGRVDVYVNHETSKVPFRTTPPRRPPPTARATSTTRR